MKAIVLIKIDTGDVKQAFRDIQRIGTISEAYLTFGLYDAIAIIHTDNLFFLGQIVSREIQTIPGIRETITCVMVETDLPVNEQAEKANQATPTTTGYFGKN